MRLWRVSRYPAIDGRGGLVANGRWHTIGHRIVYTCLHPATALLEWIAHLEVAVEKVLAHIPYVIVESPKLSIERVTALPQNWATNIAVTQTIGNRWIEERRTALLSVPCVLVPDTDNILINPAHPDAKRLPPPVSVAHPLDRRALRQR